MKHKHEKKEHEGKEVEKEEVHQDGTNVVNPTPVCDPGWVYDPEQKKCIPNGG